MKMHSPPHPGAFIQEVYINELDVSSAELARKARVSPATISRLINGKINVSPEMALRLSIVLGRSPESWLQMQANYDLWLVEQSVDLSDLASISA